MFVKVLFLFFLTVICLNAKEHALSFTPSGKLRPKTYEQSDRDLENYVGRLSREGKDLCSYGVRNAIIADYGVDIFASAERGDLVGKSGAAIARGDGMKNMLEANGFKLSSSSIQSPQRGDVNLIFYKKPPKGYPRPVGHTEYFDGEKWISDHKQPCSYAHPAFLKAIGVTPNDIIFTTYRRSE